MVVKQIYSLIEYDEAVKTMELVPTTLDWCRCRMVAFRHIACQSNACTAFRRMQASWRHLRGHHADQRSRRDDRACQRGAA